MPEQNIMLYQVSRGRADLADFIDRFGHRGVGEMELARPRWREDPTYIEAMLARYRRDGAVDPEQLHQRNCTLRRRAETFLPETLARWGGSFLRERIEGLASLAQSLLPYREVGKHYLMMGYETIRGAIVELGHRWDLGRDVFFLHMDELERFEDGRGALGERIARRKVRWQSAQRLDLPETIDSTDLDALGLRRRIEAATEMDAKPLAPGIAEGPVAIAFSPDQAVEMAQDCILVCPSTDPGWTALFPSIRGLIVERGGMLSHGAIIARDFAIPAVACPDATQIIPPGARVRVDGDRGHIAVLEGSRQ